MVSLTVTILFFALVFAGIYFIYRMNREKALHRGVHVHPPTSAERAKKSEEPRKGPPPEQPRTL